MNRETKKKMTNERAHQLLPSWSAWAGRIRKTPRNNCTRFKLPQSTNFLAPLCGENITDDVTNLNILLPIKSLVWRGGEVYTTF